MKIFLTRKIPDDGIKILKNAGLDIEIFPYDRIPKKEEIIAGIKDADALISLLADRIDKEIIDSAPKLKVIGNYAVGYNNIDVEYAKKKGIIVTNTPGVLTDATADLTFALILAAARRVVEGDKFMRQRKFKGWAPTLMLGKDVWGATIGIIGAGRIGQAVAKRAKGFNMRILYYSRKRKEEMDGLGAKFVSLEELLRESDIITLHVPFTPDTRHLIDYEEFEIMKDGAILINTARGEVVNEEVMLKALKSGKLFAAGLDVFYNEPKVNPELFKLDNVVLTPHIGSATERTRRKMAEMVCSDVVRVLRGEEPMNRVV
ncbi:D-glycerate dehydrogenase [Candidatus Aciduliprofundum boonei]|uniref:Glyoxylate reductase n=1 Tax=Aciduliprofundum boonei (strain DSM 19572 / T469) TaxID=439481 RepID=B5IFB0_ACIB4|nr:D-glycerate dehydrogenase [Candidatus Aciduliprofundum boonei]ADD07864.1 Glyoxylate reductase [Aciduliprofundum boonei T469]EDY35048.1 D-isomer specific 2-hydroxyacid dehydrogenase, catalytic domain, putative [Aciduliprofundum boonei T469]HII54969.1 D-glycerate dehydrogenase [Candidatus Aciduliprofundum boonei]